MRATFLKVALALMPLTATLHATPITYVETFFGDVTIGTDTYDGRTATLTGLGNTSTITNFEPGNYSDDVSARFSVSGGPSGTFTDDLQVSANDAGHGVIPAASFGSLLTGEYAIMGTYNASAFANYDLSYSIGPISGRALANAGDTGPGLMDPTNEGLFSVDVVTGDTTFQAIGPNGPPTTSVTPEPSSLALLGTGLFSAVAVLRRKYARP